MNKNTQVILFSVIIVVFIYRKKKRKMSVSSSTLRQGHTVLGGGIRYETAELTLLTIPNHGLKQKERILHLFSEVR